jgi:hypothetical protein
LAQEADHGWSDLLRGVVLATIPVAQLAGILTLAQLCVVALLVSVFSAFFDVAYQSYLPMLVEEDQLVDGNAKIGGSQSFAQVAGPSVGGALVGTVGAYAVAVDVVSFAVSTVSPAGSGCAPRFGRDSPSSSGTRCCARSWVVPRPTTSSRT